MFVDIAKIYIKSGDGGDGCVSFRREKYVPRGGPDGGDGGRGGDIVFEANPAMRTLLDFRYRRRYEAQRGEDGDSGRRTGRSAPPLVIEVPPGTVVRRSDTGEVVVDLSAPGERVIVLRGGRGGRGNARFTTSTRQKPAFSQPGQRTQGYEVTLELMTLADVGLVGYPNAGKSTLLAASTAARPKVGDYPFTTLSPNLGVARFDEYSFVIADIPGLIENAHQGAGLGHDFLRHIARTRMLIHVVDAAGVEGRDPVEDYTSIRRELGLFSPALLSLPEIIAANKTDIPGSQENVARLREHIGERARVLPISAVTREGVSALMRETVR
ncbi:MAG: GTPase ObgE, partial [Christensenellales bacterium]